MTLLFLASSSLGLATCSACSTASTNSLLRCCLNMYSSACLLVKEKFYFWLPLSLSFSLLAKKATKEYHWYRFLILHTKTVISSFLPPLYTISKCSVAAKLYGVVLDRSFARSKAFWVNSLAHASTSFLFKNA